jgi:hypothetical protein
MLEILAILAVQVIGAILGTLSIGGADWLYHRARIGQPLHAFWVSSSSAAIPLPLLTWTINVFLGVGWISWVLASTFGGIMFLWMSRNLLKVPPCKSLGPDVPRCADQPGRSLRRQASTASPRFRGAQTYVSSAGLEAGWQSEGEVQQETQPSDESQTITSLAEHQESLSSATPTSRAGASP